MLRVRGATPQIVVPMISLAKEILYITTMRTSASETVDEASCTLSEAHFDTEDSKGNSQTNETLVRLHLAHATLRQLLTFLG